MTANYYSAQSFGACTTSTNLASAAGLENKGWTIISSLHCWVQTLLAPNSLSFSPAILGASLMAPGAKSRGPATAAAGSGPR